jgi:hypothetical protein
VVGLFVKVFFRALCIVLEAPGPHIDGRHY